MKHGKIKTHSYAKCIIINQYKNVTLLCNIQLVIVLACF